MIAFKQATVKEIRKERPGYIEAVVDVGGDLQKAICYSRLVGGLEPGDKVVINATAVELGLGTGGFHFVVWNLSKESLEISGKGHIMKLRYTPMQLKTLAVEEEDSPYSDELKNTVSIEGMPVITGTLHSQLPAAAVALKEIAPHTRIAYIMTDGAALPLAFSNLVAELIDKGVIDSTITVGHAFGGDMEAINIYSGLVAAKHAAKADAAIVCMGPGIVGSNTRLGFTGIEQGQIINAVNSLKGSPIAIPRISFADRRDRHYGISHHTVAALKIAALSPATVTIPEMDRDKADYVDEQIRKEGLEQIHKIEKINAGITLEAMKRQDIRPTTMGRAMDEDPEAFKASGAAGIYVAKAFLGG